jgi:hypothetical protein
MQDPVGMEIEQSIQQLEHDRPDHGRWNSMPLRLSVMMNDLQQIMLCIFKYHEDAFVFQNDLF